MSSSNRRARWADRIHRRLSRWQKRKLPEALPIDLHRGRVYILPTPFGLFFSLFLFVILLGALNYNNNMALILTFLLGTLALLSPLYTVRNLAGLKLMDVAVEPVFAGENAQFELSLSNTSGSPRPMIWARLEGLPTVVSVATGQQGTIWVECGTRQRGWLAMGRCQVFTRYPIGLFQAWCWLQPKVRCLVFPRPETNAPPLPHGQGRVGEKPVRRGDEEWSGLRDYQNGDPSRWIAWKVLARTGQLVTKTFSDNAAQELNLDYHRIALSDTEAKLSRLTRWVLDAHAQGLSYSLALPHLTIAAGHGDEHRFQCLKALAEHSV